MGYKYVIYEKEEHTAFITLNRPDKRNAFDFPGQGGICDDFYAALDEADDDDDVKVVVIKGAGPSFCAGHDLNTVGRIYGMEPEKRRASERIRLKVDKNIYQKHLYLLLFNKITIAQIHGHCIGEGSLMMNFCDIAIAADDAKISYADHRLGFAGSGSNLLPLFQSVGMKRARYLLLTGRPVSGRKAEEIGLVSKSVPAKRLDAEVKDLAKDIGLLPRDGISIGKAATHLWYDALGLTKGWGLGYVTHSFFTNLRFEPDEFNFFKQREEKGVTEAMHARDKRYE
jgi:enoyl-CoA hydratase